MNGFPSDVTFAIGSHSALNTDAGIPFLGKVLEDSSQRVSGLVFPPGTDQKGRAIIIGDEEIFMTGFASGTGASYGGRQDNQSLFLNIFSYLSQAPGLDPAVQVQQMVTSIQDFDLHTGIETSLVSKLNAAINSLDQGSQIQAKNQLKAFINHVNAQSGKKITEEQANNLISQVQNIIENL